MGTVTVRLAGSALVVRVGGSGPVVGSPQQAADAILRNEAVRIPHNRGFARRLRWILSSRAIQGQGTDGNGVNWREG